MMVLPDNCGRCSAPQTQDGAFLDDAKHRFPDRTKGVVTKSIMKASVCEGKREKESKDEERKNRKKKKGVVSTFRMSKTSMLNEIRCREGMQKAEWL